MTILLNGVEFDGQLRADVTTDPKISVEELILNRPEGVTVTTEYWLVPTDGEPFQLRDGDTLTVAPTPFHFPEDETNPPANS